MKYYIIFDFDSTLVKIELLEQLGSIALKNNPKKQKILKEIKNITNKGMEGKISFTKSLKSRIELLNIKQEHINVLKPKMTRFISKSVMLNKDFFATNSKNIYVISGGFMQLILPVTNYLKINKNQVFANNFITTKTKIKVNIDNPLAKNLGKVKVCKKLKLNPKHTIVVGDGVSDYKIKKHKLAKYFVAYCENIKRDSVISKADLVVNSINDLIKFLSNL